MRIWWLAIAYSAMALCAALPLNAPAQAPIVKFVSVPDFINMDLQLDDPRLFNLTNARKAQLIAEINAGGPQASINPNVGNFVGTVENGYYGASQVLLESIAGENADFFTVSGDMLYTRWPNAAELDDPGAAQHIRNQADIYYDGWIGNVETYAGFGLENVYTIVGDHEVGDNDWSGSASNNAKRGLIPVYREVYVDKLGNEFADGVGGAYVNAPPGFEGRTYAVQRGNVLLVGLDQFETFSSSGTYTNVGSQIASVNTDVTGAQLQWLDATLTQANNDESIDHIIVMGHLPIAAQNTVKVQATSSALMNVSNETGPLWQTMVEHGVDLYLPGEVHAISMQLADDLLQVVTGTNIFQPTNAGGINSIPFDGAPVTSEQNYMVVEVYEDRIDLTLKQIETKIWGHRGLANDPLNDDPYKNREARVEIDRANEGFLVAGTLTIDLSGGHPVYSNRTGLFMSEWTFGAPLNIDLNGDTIVDILDARRFKTYFHTSLAGLSANEAFSRGDLNGDFLSNHADFRTFKIAYNQLFGGGAFERAMHVPEPSSAALAAFAVACLATLGYRRRCHAKRFWPALAAAALLPASAPAAPVTGWIVVHPETGAASTKPLSGASTDSPTLGNGGEDSASVVAMYADISGTRNGEADVALANGEKVTLSGFATMSGITSSREQFRWGLFNESTSPFDASGWTGFIASNSARSSGGALRAKPSEGGTFAQTGSAGTLGSAQDGDDFIDSTYRFTMSVSRFNEEVSIDASLTSTDGWSQVWENVLSAPPNPVTFNFNRVGFLSGNSLNANLISFHDIDVTTSPIDAPTLQVFTTGPDAGKVVLRNERPHAFNVEYYEIVSETGALNASNWKSFDDQELDDDEFEGWEEAAGIGDSLLAEYRFFDTVSIEPDEVLPLGKAFDVGGAEDLKLFVGLADGTLLRGVVEYISEGITGDFNRDGSVDAADYTVWRKELNTTHTQADYTHWRTNFGKSGAVALHPFNAVPEPGETWLLIAIAVAASRIFPRRQA